MNDVIKQLQNRKSIRKFTGEKVKEEDLKIILETAQRAANSSNCQQISLVVVRDKEKLKKIAELCDGQKHIEEADVFIYVLMDYYRGIYAAKSVGKKNISATSANGILVGTVDAGIMVNMIQTAAESLGYGTTVVGAVRSSASLQEISEFLNLPDYVFPIVGTTIGVPAEVKLTGPKPRVPLDTFAFINRYNTEKVEEGVEIHNVELKEWSDKNSTSYFYSYKDSVVYTNETLKYDKVNKVLEEKGFRFTDNPCDD